MRVYHVFHDVFHKVFGPFSVEKIACIRAIRQLTSLGLREAKELFEAMYDARKTMTIVVDQQNQNTIVEAVTTLNRNGFFIKDDPCHLIDGTHNEASLGDSILECCKTAISLGKLDIAAQLLDIARQVQDES